jgi:uncharacterized protein YyaL (SSP411 family)
MKFIHDALSTIRRAAVAAACTATLALGLPAPARAVEEKPKIEWLAWSDKIFAQAAAEKKLVLLDLGAGWCHWCHVMETTTYVDPEVVRLLRGKFLTVHVDQDARPDLANRYEDYGWPATVIFKWDGTELAKRRGYLPPKPMASMLQAFIDDPTPGPSIEGEELVVAAKEGTLTKEQRAAARKIFIEAYDAERGGWGDAQKYLHWDALEYCLTDADPKLNHMARQTLTAGLGLIDPVWGGVYQYSTDGDWEHRHFEKIMPFQTENLRVFALAATAWHEPKWLEPARKIQGFLHTFLKSPEGAFYVSQDADVVPGEHSEAYFKLDDAGRRKLGVPRVDTHRYARENGLAITGLCALYAATGDEAVLEEARVAAEWVAANRALPGGGFRHDQEDPSGPYLADSLAMARGFFALYTVTAQRPWLAKAEATLGFIETKFHAPLGYLSGATAASATLPARPQTDENLALARLANLLHHHTGKAAYRAMAEHAMRYASAPAVVARMGYGTSALLLADRELTTEPAHLTVVGARKDRAAGELFAAALRNAPGYARIEWWDPAEGPLPRAEVELPTLAYPALFICADGICSSPLRKVEEVTQHFARKR